MMEDTKLAYLHQSLMKQNLQMKRLLALMHKNTLNYAISIPY